MQFTSILFLIVARVNLTPSYAVSSYPLNYFLYAYGPAARPTLFLNWVFTEIAVLVSIIVMALLLVAIFRKRPQNTGKIIEGNTGVRWITIGTGISTIILFAMAIYAM